MNGIVTIATVALVGLVGAGAPAAVGTSRDDRGVASGSGEYLCQIPPLHRPPPPPASPPAPPPTVPTAPAPDPAAPRRIETLTGPSFEFGKAELTREGREHADRVVQVMRDDPTLRISVEGHTDDVGTHEYNMHLSQLRANAVRAYLVSQGIGADRIATQAYAETRPIATNKTAAGHALNRRVEIVAQ